MFASREKEKNGWYPYHSKQEIKKEKSSKGKNVSPKEIHTFSKVKGMYNPLRRQIPPSFVVSSLVSPKQKWHVVQHKKFPKNLTITQKIRMQTLRAMNKRKLPKEMPQEKPKETMKEEVMPTQRKPNLKGRLWKMMSLVTNLPKSWVKKWI